MSHLKGDIVIPPTIMPGGGLSPTGWSWRRGGGEAFQFNWKGPFNDLYALSSDLSADFDSLEIRKAAGEGDFYELQAAQAGDEITEVHEINGSQLMESKLENLVLKKRLQALTTSTPPPTHPLLQFTDANYVKMIAELGRIATAYMGDNSTEAAETMRKNLAVAFNKLEAPGTVPWNQSDFWPDGQGALVAEFIYDLRKGEHVFQMQYIYRHSLVFPDRIFKQSIGSFSGIYSNVLKVHTEQQMRTAENIPSVAGDYFEIPKSVVNPANTALWLKQPPKVSLTLFQRREIQIEYVSADRWSSLYFENVQNPSAGIR